MASHSSIQGSWTREKTAVLIDSYQKHELLWNSKMSAYRNKERRKEALTAMAEDMRAVMPAITIDDIKSKINGIRTQFVSELNRIAFALVKNEAYEPTLWFYEKLSFIKPYAQPKMRKPAQSNIDWDNWKIQMYTKENAQTVQTVSQIPAQESYAVSDESLHNTEDDDKNKIKMEYCSDDDIQIIEDDKCSIDQQYQQQNGAENEVTTSKDQSHTEDNFWETKTPETTQSEQDILKLISTARNNEITIIPKKRKIEETEEPQRTKVKKCECNNSESLDVFGQFVAMQVQTITNKKQRLKLMHAIQNAIIEAQIRQMDEEDKI